MMDSVLGELPSGWDALGCSRAPRLPSSQQDDRIAQLAASMRAASAAALAPNPHPARTSSSSSTAAAFPAPSARSSADSFTAMGLATPSNNSRSSVAVSPFPLDVAVSGGAHAHSTPPAASARSSAAMSMDWQTSRSGCSATAAAFEHGTQLRDSLVPPPHSSSLTSRHSTNFATDGNSLNTTHGAARMASMQAGAVLPAAMAPAPAGAHPCWPAPCCNGSAACPPNCTAGGAGCYKDEAAAPHAACAHAAAQLSAAAWPDMHERTCTHAAVLVRARGNTGGCQANVAAVHAAAHQLHANVVQLQPQHAVCTPFGMLPLMEQQEVLHAGGLHSRVCMARCCLALDQQQASATDMLVAAKGSALQAGSLMGGPSRATGDEPANTPFGLNKRCGLRSR